MNYFPLSIALQNRDVLIVGGGDIALRKAILLKKAGANIHVVAPAINDQLRKLASSLHFVEYNASKIDEINPTLIISATNHQDLNHRVACDAQVRNILVNAVDQPSDSDFIFPAIIERGPMTVAISSGGSSPVLARYWRTKLDAIIPQNVANLSKFLARTRNQLKSMFPDFNVRRRLMERFLVDHRTAMAQTDDEYSAIIEEVGEREAFNKGAVYLIGAGPGDPELLTFKAVRLLQSADVVVYDRLVNPKIIEMARRDAQFIYVGKKAKEHVVPQDEINALLKHYALEGKIVARVKGGDPYIFGRGAEEIETLCDEGIDFSVVPGITAASGCASYAGIPLTHRDHAQSVRFITGHLKDGSIDLNWASLRDPTQTLVFYMGLGGLSIITSKLMANGRVPSTPIALVEKGTTNEQRVFIGRLDDIVDKTANKQLSSPTLIIVGDVVLTQSSLRWRNDTFE